MSNISLEDLRKAVDSRDETVLEFSEFVDKLVGVLARADIVLPKNFKLEYFPSREYTLKMGREAFCLTHNKKGIDCLLIFAQAIEEGWLAEVQKRVEHQTSPLKSALKKGQKELANMQS